MNNEIIACILDKDIKFLHSGQVAKYVFPMDRKTAHQKEISHLIVRLFIVSITPKNQISYLVQKRSKSKNSFPDYFTDSASGHVLYKENLKLGDIEENARRELEEEFGIQRKFIEKIIFFDLITEKEKKSIEIAYLFLGLVKHNAILDPNPMELEPNGSRFYSKPEMVSLLKNEEMIDHSKQIWMKLIKSDLIAKFGFNSKRSIKKNSEKNVALFIGRFQPLHHGHIYILTKVLKSYRKLKIGIGSSQLSKIKSDPFTYEERVKFITSALKKRGIPSERYEIFPIPDIFNANKWVEHVIGIVGEFDTVFSNSDWVRQLFQIKGMSVGEKIEIFKKKYNGSNVRKLISKENKNWKSLVPKEISDLIVDYNGIELIKTLFKKENLI
jgi:nicotinamide-nucleotide adenylyltransferase